MGKEKHKDRAIAHKTDERYQRKRGKTEKKRVKEERKYFVGCMRDPSPDPMEGKREQRRRCRDRRGKIKGVRQFLVVRWLYVRMRTKGESKKTKVERIVV